MADAAGGGEDTWVHIPPGRCLMRYVSENEREADIRHGKIEIGGISVEKSFLRFDTWDEARDVHENLSKLEGDSFLKSCLIISHGGYWLAVDRFDCSLKRYCDKHPVCWNKSEVQLDPKDELSDTNQKEVISRKDEKHGDPNQKEVVIRDIITGIYQLHSQEYWHGDLSIRDILIVNHRAKFAFIRGARVDPKKRKRGVHDGSPDKRKEDFEKLRTVFKGVLGTANSGQSNMPRTELNHFHKNAAQKINNWPSLAKLFFHPLLMTPLQRFHLPITMHTLVQYQRRQWREKCIGYQWQQGAKWKENVRGHYEEILNYRKNNTQDQIEYNDDAWGQFTFVRNTIVHINDSRNKNVDNATSSRLQSSRGSNRPKKTAEEVEQELSVMLPSSFTNVYNLFNVKALASTSVSQLYGETLEENGIDLAEMKVLRRKMEELGIDSNLCKPGQYNHLICPMCKGGDSGEKSLSLFITANGNSALWTCFRAKCGWRGNTGAYVNGNSTSGRIAHIPKVKQTREITEKSLDLEPPCSELCAYFAERMISGETLRRNAVMQRRYGDQIVIAFPYRRNGELVSCKYRDINKKFWQEKDTEKIFYGLDDIKDSNDIIIVEGEMDKLAMEEAGFQNCVSVPDGAPASVSKKELPSEEQDTKYQYLWNCKEYLEKASRIILATDGDLPGQALAEELARRLGRERCWRVKWPKKNDVDHFKDANEVVPGELTIVTGVPNSGKSEWIDALLSNLNASVGWKFALCSMENKVREHARKLLEKHIKKPFFDARYGESVERMSVDELEQGKKWLSDTFYLIRCENDCLPSINWVLGLAKAAVLRHGVNGLVIDPYNELDHQRPPSQTETEYVSQMLTKVKRFAQHHSCHVWFVAHPRQLHHWVGSPPNLYDISGSAHFINKCDNGIVIHRNRDPDAGPMDQVQVCVRKVRNKVAGTIGDAFLSYNRVTGEFMDLSETLRRRT